MTNDGLHVVTGAFGYSGKYITQRLLAAGHRVRTLTNSIHRSDPFQGAVEVCPLDFNHPEKLAAALEGASVLYNTYWVRFNHARFNQADAVRNTLALFEAAARTGVHRVVHVSITNPSSDSPLEYFRGKAVLENALEKSGLSYAILRPAVLFGHEDILVNNIAWVLRHLPVFGVFGRGEYRLQPIHVDDFADLAVEQGAGLENATIDAIGPETFTYRGLVRAIGECIGVWRPIVSVPPWLGYAAGWCVGKWVDDVTITRDEIKGLMADLLYTSSPPTGKIALTDWATAERDRLGRHYASELARRRNLDKAYGEL